MIKTESYKIREIKSKDEAVKYGKDRGWCTADPKSNDYESTYSLENGNLFIIYEKDKKKPEAQLFISNSGSIEIKKKFNQSCDLSEFREDSEFNNWLIDSFPDAKEKPKYSPPEYYREALRIHDYEVQERRDVTLKIISVNGQFEHVNNMSEFNDIEKEKGTVYYIAERSTIFVSCGDGGFVEFQCIESTTSLSHGNGMVVELRLFITTDEQIRMLLNISNELKPYVDLNIHRSFGC